MTGSIAQLGQRVTDGVLSFGDFCRFSAQTLLWTLRSVLRWRTLRLLLPQLYLIGTKSLPVVMITGGFVGMVLAVQTVAQFKALGLQGQMGTVVNLSVLRELGPVLAGVALAGRVGGGLTAELGTMRVTEQIDAMRAMGADPIRVLVVPRFLACVLLIPVLTIYADFMGVLGGYAVSTYVYGIGSGESWWSASGAVGTWDIAYGIIKSVAFGAAISLICCYKGFHCRAGAAGVGRACTESFVASCMTILGLDFFIGMYLATLYRQMYGLRMII